MANELQGFSIDVHYEGTKIRLLAPSVSLGKDMMGHVGKTIAMLWQIFLLVGPHFDDMRLFLNHLGGFTSDYGAEHLMVDAHDLLGDFLEAVGLRFQQGLTKQEHTLMPFCAPHDWLESYVG